MPLRSKNQRRTKEHEVERHKEDAKKGPSRKEGTLTQYHRR